MFGICKPVSRRCIIDITPFSTSLNILVERQAPLATMSQQNWLQKICTGLYLTSTKPTKNLSASLRLVLIDPATLLQTQHLLEAFVCFPFAWGNLGWVNATELNGNF